MMRVQLNGYHTWPQFASASLPPSLAARMQTWASAKEPTLEAKQEMGDYLWQCYDRGLLPMLLSPQLAEDCVTLRGLKRNMYPDKWAKVEEEFQELVAEVPEIDPKTLEPFHVKGEFDAPFTEPHWVQFLAALKWPYISIEKFMQFEALKIDGRLRYQAAHPDVPKEERKAALKPYETGAAEYVFNRQA